MSNIKVVDVNNEEDKQEVIEQPIEQPIEEAKEEVSNEVVEEPQVQQETKTEEVEEVCKEVKKPIKAQDAKPCVKAQDATQEPRKLCDKLVRCPKCNKEMKLKSLRYGHEQKCQGTLEQKPVKPFSKPRATPKPKAQPIQQPIQAIEPKPTQPVQNQIVQPRNPLADLTNHYQLLQQQFIQQKKEKYNTLCQNMFTSKSKKR